MTKQSIKTENRLSTLEANYISLSDSILEIKDNHLVHLSNDIRDLKLDISAIDRKIAMWSGGIAVIIWLTEKLM